MGCHTWFYVCLEERQKEIQKDYFNRIVSGTKQLLQWYKETEESEWQKDFEDYCKNGDRDYWKNKIYPDCKSLEELQGWSDSSIINNIKLGQVKTWQDYRDFYINLHSSAIECLEKCNSLDDVVKLLPDYLDNEDGLEYKEGKVYIEACSEAADKYLSRRMHDLFRIHNYEAKNCYSVEDCIQRCVENNVTLTDEELKELKEWYKEYPNTLIEFG